MQFFKWHDKYKLNIDIIDEQHRELVELLNNLCAAMQAGKTQRIMKKFLHILFEHTETHFATEEKLLAKHNYPAYLSHKKEHEAFTRKLNEIQQQFKKGDIMLPIKIKTFLKEWLQNHVLITDRKYASFLNKKEIN